MAFFDDDDDENDYSLPRRQPQAGPSRRPQAPQRSSDPIRESSIFSSSTETGPSNRSFLQRLESTRSPSRDYSLGLDDLHSDNAFGLGAMDSSTAGMDLDINGGDDGDDDDVNDVKRMGKVWVKERGTVDIMPWDGDLMDDLFNKLEQQQGMVNALRDDPKTTEEEHFKLVLVQTEMERVKFLIRSYVRTRLHKIERYSHHIVITPELHNLLSGAELSHARRYTELLHTHYQHSVLDSLPDWLQNMDDTYGDGLSMISKPNKNVPVLIYCKQDCGEIILEDGERAELGKGTTHLVKYSLVERWISLGWAEVL